MMLRALSVLMLVLFAAPAPALAQDCQWKELAEAGVNYRQELVSNVPANKRQPSLIPRLRNDADAEYRGRRHPQPIEELTPHAARGRLRTTRTSKPSTRSSAARRCSSSAAITTGPTS